MAGWAADERVLHVEPVGLSEPGGTAYVSRLFALGVSVAGESVCCHRAEVGGDFGGAPSSEVRRGDGLLRGS